MKCGSGNIWIHPATGGEINDPLEFLEGLCSIVEQGMRNRGCLGQTVEETPGRQTIIT